MVFHGHDGAHGHPRGGGDVPHGCGSEAPEREEPAGLRQDRGLGPVPFGHLESFLNTFIYERVQITSPAPPRQAPRAPLRGIGRGRGGVRVRVGGRIGSRRVFRDRPGRPWAAGPQSRADRSRSRAGRSASAGPGALFSPIEFRFWRCGRIVRADTPGASGGFRMIPRFPRNGRRVWSGTILPERHFSHPHLYCSSRTRGIRDP